MRGAAEAITGRRETQKAPELPRTGGVRAADRALAVLTAFRREDTALTPAELVTRTGLQKRTVLRVAESLQGHRLLARLSDGSLRLGAEVFRLGNAFQAEVSLADYVLPALERLAARTGETASFYVKRGEERLCLLRVASSQPVRMHLRPGDTGPLGEAAIGQVLRRYGGESEGSPPLGDAIFTTGIGDPDAASIAVPVFGEKRAFLGALAISGPVTRLSPDRARELKATLVEVGVQLTLACGSLRQ